jgi:hypothetical protein
MAEPTLSGRGSRASIEAAAESVRTHSASQCSVIKLAASHLPRFLLVAFYSASLLTF